MEVGFPTNDRCQKKWRHVNTKRIPLTLPFKSQKFSNWPQARSSWRWRVTGMVEVEMESKLVNLALGVCPKYKVDRKFSIRQRFYKKLRKLLAPRKDTDAHHLRKMHLYIRIGKARIS